MSREILSNGTTDNITSSLGMQGNRWTDDLPECKQTSLGTIPNAIYHDGHSIEEHEFEDRNFFFSLEDGKSLYGVFDGHDGSRLSNFVAQRIPAELLLDQNCCFSGQKTDKEIQDLLQQAFIAVERGYFESVDDLLNERAALQLQIRENMNYGPFHDTQKKLLQDVEAKISGGTTATVALIHNNKLFVTNVGNTRALFCSAENGVLHVTQLTVDHTISNDDELRRLKQLGVDVEKLKITRKLGKTENTRLIGDHSVKGGYKDIDILSTATSEPVIAEPHVCRSFDINSSAAFLLIMSHGLYKAIQDIQSMKDDRVNQDIAKMVALEFTRQSSLKYVAPAVVRRVVNYHMDAYNKCDLEWRRLLQKREDISLLVRNFNYPVGAGSGISLGIGGSTSSTPSPHHMPSQHRLYQQTSLSSPTSPMTGMRRMYSQNSQITDPPPQFPSHWVSPITNQQPIQQNYIISDNLFGSGGPNGSSSPLHIPHHMSPVNTNESDSSRSSTNSKTQTTTNSPSSTQQTVSSQTSTATGTNSTQSNGDSPRVTAQYISTNKLQLDNDGKVESYVDFSVFDQCLSEMTEIQRDLLFSELKPKSDYDPIVEESETSS